MDTSRDTRWLFVNQSRTDGGFSERGKKQARAIVRSGDKSG